MLNISKNLQNQLNSSSIIRDGDCVEFEEVSPLFLMSHFVINKTYYIDSKKLCKIKTAI